MLNHNSKNYLDKKIVPFNIKSVKNVEDLLVNLQNCGFQGKNLGIGLEILYKMVSNKDILTVLTLSGAMVPAGMGDIICSLMENKLIDVLITTGANIIHDLVDVFSNIGHFIGSSNIDDNELFNKRINRIYDVFLPEDKYTIAENEILKRIHTLYPNKNIKTTPSELFKLLGDKIENRCIVSIAAKNNIPIFVPAFSDSEFALNLIKYSVREGYDFQFDILEDVKKYAEIIKKSKKNGTIIIGGGVPRNWAQQVFPLLDQIGEIKTMGFNYSVRIHTATEYDGGLSGCTVSESKSWGKYALDSRFISIWCDATIALPILITGLFQRLELL
ncbi:MAG: deoxyhypusine synthase family protein [Candidatus Lokiarchaeota archaeon]|nr:deoxyhypusine synthase family protein [Candidatus Lokiarchaeota archaeon]